MARLNASQGSRRDARNPSDERWPRVGATVEDGAVVVRPLEDGEEPHPSLKRAVRVAEPCERHQTLAEAVRYAAAALAQSIREKAKGRIPVVVRVV